MPEFSIIIPAFNSASIVGETIHACLRVAAEHHLDCEVIVVDDGSIDGTWEILRARSLSDPNVTAVRLLRNYGQHTAVHCGLRLCRGEYAVVLDDDMQNPPSEMLSLIGKARAGHDLVFGRFRVKQHSIGRRLGSRLMNRVNTAVFAKPPDLTLTNFKIMHRSVIDRVLAHRTHDPYINGLALLYARNATDVEVEHRARVSGRSNYDFVRILSLVTRILFNYSAFPLRLVSAIGMIAALASLVMAGFVLAKALLIGSTVPGWASTTVALTFFNGITLLMLAFIGEYVVRLLKQSSSADPYVIVEVERTG